MAPKCKRFVRASPATHVIGSQARDSKMQALCARISGNTCDRLRNRWLQNAGALCAHLRQHKPQNNKKSALSRCIACDADLPHLFIPLASFGLHQRRMPPTVVMYSWRCRRLPPSFSSPHHRLLIAGRLPPTSLFFICHMYRHRCFQSIVMRWSK